MWVRARIYLREHAGLRIHAASVFHLDDPDTPDLFGAEQRNKFVPHSGVYASAIVKNKKNKHFCKNIMGLFFYEASHVLVNVTGFILTLSVVNLQMANLTVG